MLIPQSERYFEHYTPGLVVEFGSAAITEAAIIAFASEYDPQEMHIDQDWAERGPFGQVIASGWHTIAAAMRLYVDHFLPKCGLAAPGIDELRWTRPVRPGDALRVRVTVLEARRSRSKPDRGLIHCLFEVLNQNDELVLTMKPLNLLRCHPESLVPGA